MAKLCHYLIDGLKNIKHRYKRTVISVIPRNQHFTHGHIFFEKKKEQVSSYLKCQLFYCCWSGCFGLYFVDAAVFGVISVVLACIVEVALISSVVVD